MPREHFGPGHHFLDRPHLLTFDEIERLARLFVALGVRKLRLTGGEPLLRDGIEDLVRSLAAIPDVDLAMTTNGAQLATKAADLATAGLLRLTVSLDALDDDVYRALTDTKVPVRRVLEGIDAAARVGLNPIKVNMVVKRGVNDHAVLPVVEFFRGTGHTIRFIEYMDVGTTNRWRLDEVVPAADVLELIHRERSVRDAVDAPADERAQFFVATIGTRLSRQACTYHRDDLSSIESILGIKARWCSVCGTRRP
jgi:cyclic pyranopterin phosphate synthase